MRTNLIASTNDVAQDVMKNIKAGAANGAANGDAGVFRPLVDASWNAGRDFYTLLTNVALYGGVCMLIIAIIMYMTSSNSQAKQGAKQKAIWILVGVGCVFLSVWIVSVVFKAGQGL